MSIKKILAAALVCVCAMQTSLAFAYDVKEDDDLREKWDVFVNKYPYDSELQLDLFFDKYAPKYSLTVDAMSYSESTGKVSAGFYDDGAAAFFEASAPEQSETKLLVNGEKEYPCIIFKSRSLVPAEAFESAGCVVETDEETRVTSISKDGEVVELMPYLLDMRKNKDEGFWVPLEICSRYAGENNEHYVPLRVIADELGLTVDWDNDNRTATLDN